MDEKEKKPPIDLREVEKKEDKFKPGALEYTGDTEKKPKKASAGMNWTQVLASSVIALLLAVVVMFQFAPSKGDVAALFSNQNELVERIDSVQSSFDKESTRVDNIVNTQGDYAKKSELSGYATKSEISALSSLPGVVDTGLKSLDATISGLVARIVELEADGGGGGDGGDEDITDGVTIDLGYSGYFVFPKGVPATGQRLSMEQILFFNVESALEVDIENVELLLTLHSRGIPITFDSCVVTGGWPLQWQVVHVGSGLVVLRGSSPSWSEGLEIEAGRDEEVYLTLTLELEIDKVLEKDVTLYVEAEVKDYDIVE